MSSIRIVAGLGNPGRRYAATRHNAGFWFVDLLCDKLAVSMTRESRFACDVARSGDIRIARPATYMNESGRAIGALVNFFAVASDELLVVHDELDLKPGDAKLKYGGGVAGHNGLRDIRDKLGTEAFWRLRLGIGHARDSAVPQQDVADYVLEPPRPDEKSAIDEAVARALTVWSDIARGDLERAMMALHTKRPAGLP